MKLCKKSSHRNLHNMFRLILLFLINNILELPAYSPNNWVKGVDSSPKKMEVHKTVEEGCLRRITYDCCLSLSLYLCNECNEFQYVP